jgi:SAM-dependent methyltransferase
MRDVPETAELEENLAWERTYAAEALRRAREQPVFTWFDLRTRWLLRLFPRVTPAAILNRRARGGPVVDVGCGDGANLRKLDARFVPYGVEISRRLAAEAEAFAKTRGGYVAQTSARLGLQAFPDEFFSGALLVSYLEHDADAAAVLALLARKLRPDGLAVAKTPNFASWNRRVMGRAWCGLRLPDHVNYFTPASLTQMAKGAGLAARFPPLLRLPTNDNMIALLTPIPFLRRDGRLA